LVTGGPTLQPTKTAVSGAERKQRKMCLRVKRERVVAVQKNTPEFPEETKKEQRMFAGNLEEGNHSGVA